MAVDLNKYNTPAKKGVDLNKYNMPGIPADSPEAQQYHPVNRLKSKSVTSSEPGILEKIEGWIGTPTQPGEGIGAGLPTEFQTQTALLENALKGLVRFPPQMMQDVLQRGPIKAGAGLLKFPFDVATQAANMAGAQIPPSTQIGEVPIEQIQAPTGAEARQQAFEDPTPLLLALVPLLKARLGGKPTPAGLEPKAVIPERSTTPPIDINKMLESRPEPQISKKGQTQPLASMVTKRGKELSKGVDLNKINESSKVTPEQARQDIAQKTQGVAGETVPPKIVIGGEGKKIREFMAEKAKPKEPWEEINKYKGSDGGNYIDYAIRGDRNQGMLTIELDKKAGHRIRNVFVDNKSQRQGYASDVYKILNNKSIRETGKPLRSSEIGYAKKESLTSMSPDAMALWESFVKKGQAQKVGNHYEFYSAPLEAPKGNLKTEQTVGKSEQGAPLKEPAPTVNQKAEGKIPLTPKAEPPATVPPKPKPVATTPAPEGTIGLKKDIIADVRESIGLNQIEEPMRKRFGQSLEEARNTKLTESALDIAQEVKQSRRPINDVEHSAMTIKAAELANEYQAAQKTISELIEKGNKAAADIETKRANIIADNLDLLTEASDYAGTEIARALSIRRMLVNKETFDLASIVQRARARKGKPLTESEMKKANELAVRFEETNKKLKELEDKYNAELSNREKIIAERIAKIEAGKARITVRAEASRAKVKAERESLYKQLESMGYTLRSAGLSADEVYILGKIAVTYAKEGMVNISEIAQQIRTKIPEFTDRDVIQALAARDPKKQARARQETAKRINMVKQQARLMLKIEEAEKNLFAPKKRPATPPEIRSLQKTLRDARANAYRTVSDANRLDRIINRINEVQDQLANQYRDVRKQRKVDPAQIEQAKKQLADLRKEMRIQDELADLESQMTTGEFKIPETKPARELPPDLERQQIELKRVKREARQMIDDLAPVTPRKVLGETVNTLRTLKATADMSGVLRQGAILTVAYPGKVPRAFGQTLKATFSRYKAEQIDNAIRSDPSHYLRERAGLELTELGVSKITRREEMFGSRLLERIPVLKTVIGASERNMTTYLNLMRTGVFDDFMKKFPNASQAELKAMANWINVTTGRGNLGRFAGVANELSLAFFAPKFAVSRIQTPYKVFQYWRMPRVRNQIAKDMAATVGTGMALLGLAKLAGFEVGDDPRNADWGKVRVGDSRIDIWAGHQQPLRVIARIGIGATDRIGITGKDLTDYEKNIDPLELIGRFASYKLGPGITLPKELLTGRDIIGEKRMLTETMADQVIPLWIQDVRDAAKSDGWGQAAFTGGLTFMGIGVSTYGDGENATREKAKKLISTGKNDEAVALIKKWNTENPNNKIVKLK